MTIARIRSARGAALLAAFAATAALAVSGARIAVAPGHSAVVEARPAPEAPIYECGSEEHPCALEAIVVQA